MSAKRPISDAQVSFVFPESSHCEDTAPSLRGWSNA
jgi:hypothetical protein